MTDASAAQDPNSDMREFWNGEAANKWVEFNDQLDRMMADVTGETMARAAPVSGERVLDVGCGCGGTSLILAEKTAPGGAVTGLDISTPMLDKARDRAAAVGAAATFINGDAETHDLPQAVYDMVFSRYGVMFFSDPKAAFMNFFGALRPGGRTTFACWRELGLNPWVTIPYEAAQPFAPAFEVPGRDAPGQFAFARKEWIEEILTHGGFADIRIESFETPQRVGDGDLDSCVDIVLKLGLVSRLMREAEPQAAPKIRAAVRAAVAPYHDGTSISMDSAVWIVSARRP